MTTVEVGAFGSLVVTSVEVAEVEVRELGLCAGEHLVVEAVWNDGLTGEQPKEGLGDATSVNYWVGGVVSVDNLVVGLAWGGKEGNEALTWLIWAVTSSGDSSSGTKGSTLLSVVNSKVTISDESRVFSLDAGGIIRLEELALDVLLFVPNTHVGGTVEVGEGSGMIANDVRKGFSEVVHVWLLKINRL